MSPRQPRALSCLGYATTIIGVILLVPVILVLVYRHAAEKKYDTVELAADYYQLMEVADSYNYPLDIFLKQVKGTGVEAVALLEDTPHNLENRGLCYVIHGTDWIGFQTLEERKKIKALGGEEPREWDKEGMDLRLAYGLDPVKTHLVFTDNMLGEKVGKSGASRYNQRVSTNQYEGMTVVSISGEERLVYELGLGFNTDRAAKLSAMGFRVIPRFRNDRYLEADAINHALDEVFSSPDFARGVIFDGDEVLGYPKNIPTVVSKLNQYGAYFGWVEFAKQAGEKSIAAQLPGLTVRVHSIEDKEMEIYTPAKAIARFARAVRERGSRLVYLKPFRFPQGPDNIGRTVEYFGKVNSAVIAEGMKIGTPSMFDGGKTAWQDPARNWAKILIAFYVLMVATYLVGNEMRYWPKWIGLVPVIAIIVIGIIFSIKPQSSIAGLILKILALLAALSFPILGISELTKTLSNTGVRKGIIRGLIYWFATVFFAFLGGLIVASLLAERDYMLQIQAFSGVKLSLVLPVLAALVLGVRLVVPPERVQQGLWDNIRYLFDFQLQMKHVVGFLILAGAGLFLLMRSGNEPLVGVGEFESGFRAKLEALMYARPRTKEFLIGHPLLIAGILWHLRGRKGLGYLAIVGGSIGLASVTNTFCHLHIPIALSLLRTFWGALLGLVIGILLYYVAEALFKIAGYSPCKEALHVGKEP